ncbi:hypothetical protein C5E45_19105 [Nocardia nova]|uniref:Uncharacterized protein n=1 Tax=Nocardia nova TaxID=37330 RepID=A0A2S6AMT7_9NOCA|nr:hypothetical protein [Nocardia nova]PPJ36538.1 hypothetical protein C5E45_19105 [Nocardia nova]
MQSWIDTDSAKMVASFEGEKGLRYGVLVFPSMVSGFAMTRTLSEDFLDLAVVPNRPLTLPEGVDTFIAVAGGQAIRFTPPDCWERIVLQHNDSHID